MLLLLLTSNLILFWLESMVHEIINKYFNIVDTKDHFYVQAWEELTFELLDTDFCKLLIKLVNFVENIYAFTNYFFCLN